MGIYAIDCPTCGKPFPWWSGNLDQRCNQCRENAMGTAVKEVFEELREMPEDQFQAELRSGRVTMPSELGKLQAKLKLAEEALEYYAHPDHYEPTERLCGTRPAGVLVERGNKARTALAELRKP